jgi:hypothetical protein
MLGPGGVFVFDVFTSLQFSALFGTTSHAWRLMDGFWSPSDYFGFLKTFLYTERKISRDRYLIVEPEPCFEIHDWMRYFDARTIAAEVREAGFELLEILDAVTGEPWAPAPRELAVVARKDCPHSNFK